MTDDPLAAEAMPPEQRPARRWLSSRTTAATVLVLTFVVGALAGVAFDRSVLLPRMFWGYSHGRFGGGFGHGGPGRGPVADHRMRDHLANELQLTPAQRVQMDSILDRSFAQLHDIRSHADARVFAVFDSTRVQISRVLTPAQEAKMEEIRQRHGWGKWRTRPRGDQMPGGPGGPSGMGGPGSPPPQQP